MTISDIETEARALCDADTTSYTAALLLIRENNAYEDIVAQILAADGLWQFDDSRYTTFPIATTTMVASQEDYSFDSSMLDVESVDVLDSAGNWNPLRPIDPSQVGQAWDEFEETDGLPLYYDKIGNSLVLKPAPASGSVTLTSGLKVRFRRTASLFTSSEQTTGTTSPGFASPFHVLISYKAALPFCMSYKPARVPLILSEINRLETKLKEHYSRREQDRRKIITMGGVSST